MLRTALLSLIFLVSLSSSSKSLFQKSISRRQSDSQYCQVIEGFDCKCIYHRVTCTNDHDLQSPIKILPNEKNKYQSVELVITAPTNINVDDRTFEPVKELYQIDGEAFEFRIKFEKFTGLHLTSPGFLNRVFPDNIPQNAAKRLALEIYNPDVQPHDNIHLFQNLHADSLELYALYPFRGTFQQLFDGANIKFLRLSGGDIRSDLSQPFSGTISRLELAKQASALSVQNFPAYPAHELTINAFYITDFNPEYAPNYDNLVELRVFSPQRIPANAFRQYPNLRVLSVSSSQDIDPHALDGLNNLEKLTIKDTKPSLELLSSVPNVKEFETNMDKLDENTQCQFLEKLANGQIAVQAIPNGRECTCVSAYLDTAAGRSPCDAQHCEHASCAAIKNNYDASARTFKAPPPVQRSDGTIASQPREPRVYTTPFRVSPQDQEKLQRAIPHDTQQQQPPSEDGSQRPAGGDEQNQQQPDQSHQRPDTHPSWPTYSDKNHIAHPHDYNKLDTNDVPSGGDNNQNERTDSEYPSGGGNNQNEKIDSEYPSGGGNNQNEKTDSEYPSGGGNNQNEKTDSEYSSSGENNQNEKTDSEYPSGGENNQNEKIDSEHPVGEGNNQNEKTDSEHPSGGENNQNEKTDTDYPSDQENNQNEEDNIDRTTVNNNPNDDDDDSKSDLQPTTPILSDFDSDSDKDTTTTTIPESPSDDSSGGQDPDGNANTGDTGATPAVGDENQVGGGGEGQEQPSSKGDGENPPDGNVGGQPDSTGTDTVGEPGSVNGTVTATPPKKGMSWLPIIIVAAAIGGIILIGLIVILIHKRRPNKGYNPASTQEQPRA